MEDTNDEEKISAWTGLCHNPCNMYIQCFGVYFDATAKNLSFYTNGMTQTQKNAAMDAAYTWSCVTKGISFGTMGDRTEKISFDDSVSDVGFMDFNVIDWYYQVPTTASGYCWTDQNNNYNKFDIVLNSNCYWGSGNSSNYLDMQGNFTHEFGHAAGLGHSGTMPGNGSPANTPAASYPTMWPNTTDVLGNNVTYYWRTLENDDISGVQYVYTLIK